MAETSLVCSEEMMDESPDVSLELKEMSRYKNQLPSQVIVRHKELTALPDDNILHDKRVLPSMLVTEKVTVGYVNNYFRTVQDDLTPEMKSTVAVWMFEVCEEERMHVAVFLRAIQYMDKFLSLQRISRTQLQLLGAVCLLESSKIAGTTISLQRLVSYTADSVTPDMLLQWEDMLLTMLNWDMYGVVSSDFVPYILQMLPKELWDNTLVTERIKTFTAYCAVDHQFGVHLPSVIASASIAAALTPLVTTEVMDKVLYILQSATNINIQQLKSCMEQITAKVQVTVEEKLKSTKACGESPSDPETVTASSPNNGCRIKSR
ncbi:unnamed protein product [Orchesella dallaii]|uniref:G1/S-specific cyclin-D2 n=1 Tax=Orchesella dallaii TaxID=48710 RepID=A0ABP1Q3T8_9HEXA